MGQEEIDSAALEAITQLTAALADARVMMQAELKRGLALAEDNFWESDLDAAQHQLFLLKRELAEGRRLTELDVVNQRDAFERWPTDVLPRLPLVASERIVEALRNWYAFLAGRFALSAGLIDVAETAGDHTPPWIEPDLWQSSERDLAERDAFFGIVQSISGEHPDQDDGPSGAGRVDAAGHQNEPPLDVPVDQAATSQSLKALSDPDAWIALAEALGSEGAGSIYIGGSPSDDAVRRIEQALTDLSATQGSSIKWGQGRRGSWFRSFWSTGIEPRVSIEDLDGLKRAAEVHLYDKAQSETAVNYAQAIAALTSAVKDVDSAVLQAKNTVLVKITDQDGKAHVRSRVLTNAEVLEYDRRKPELEGNPHAVMDFIARLESISANDERPPELEKKSAPG